MNFRGDCAEAIRHYETHLAAKLGIMLTHAQSPEKSRLGPEWKDAVLARIAIGGNELLAADIPNAEPMRSAYLTLRVGSDTDAERVFPALSECRRVLMPIEDTSFASRFGQCQDRFGINWMILYGRPMPAREG